MYNLSSPAKFGKPSAYIWPDTSENEISKMNRNYIDPRFRCIQYIQVIAGRPGEPWTARRGSVREAIAFTKRHEEVRHSRATRQLRSIAREPPGAVLLVSAKCCSFSAVSAPIFARKYAFCSIFQNLPDSQAEFFEI